MASKTLQSKIQSAFDTAANWQNSNRVFLLGEKVYAKTSNGSIRSKTGDGTHTFQSLPYDDEALYESLSGKAEKSTAVSATLLASGWSAKSQTVSIQGVNQDTNGIVSTSQEITNEEMEAVVAGELYVSGQGNGTVTISALGTVPEINIPIVVILIS